jgi:Ca-activated chloride channel homolog
MKIIKPLIFLFAAAVFSLPVCAQDEEPIRIETDLVSVNVAVTDKKGRYVENLQKENFEIFDNGVRQELEYFSAPDAPVSFGIVFDMHPTTDERTRAVLESLKEFTGGLSAQDDFFTLVFNKRGSLVVDFVPTAEQVETQLRGQSGEPNALYDAIYLAAEKLRARPNVKKVLLVITDSADHNSEHRFKDVLGRIKTFDAQVYTVLWDESQQWEYADITRDGSFGRKVSGDASNLSRAALQELALRTGGTVHSPTVQNARELFRLFSQIAYEMRKTYTLGFYPEKTDGQWHELKLTLRSVKNSKKSVLTYRSGYQSPERKEEL